MLKVDISLVSSQWTLGRMSRNTASAKRRGAKLPERALTPLGGA